jgi:hypothetical protein
MIKIQILEHNDKIQPDDWCRPLDLDLSHDDFSTKSCYSGKPMNNTKWVKVKHVLGTSWHNKKVSYVNSELGEYEFIRGNVPRMNQLDLTDYNI